ncbi:hypothetical protein [Rhizobium rhizophilum]|uniref:Uncharacterized protein n=1 Tax=Rhizobium rhizophilum TaxID=1850373 RepID=A0ABY2QR52_9HYPH|nr:hypothetical protein [Rhizobium rhizophilum]THV10590.1 hypothetical protein E9677_22840 [Rhizobium rhizophilum]
MEQQIANLPPMALISFGAVLAVIFAVRTLGLWQGQSSSPTNSPATAQVVAVVFDPIALNRASLALEAHNRRLKALTFKKRGWCDGTSADGYPWLVRFEDGAAQYEDGPFQA